MLYTFRRFVRVCNYVADSNAQNKCLRAKLLQQGYRYYKLKTFSKIYRRHFELISKFYVGEIKCKDLIKKIQMAKLLREVIFNILEPELYGDLGYKKKLKGQNEFPFQFRIIIIRYNRIVYNLNVCMLSL